MAMVKNSKEKFGSLNVSDYEVYTTLDSKPYGDILKEQLEKKYPDYTFKLQDRLMYWKEIEMEFVIGFGKIFCIMVVKILSRLNWP